MLRTCSNKSNQYLHEQKAFFLSLLIKWKWYRNGVAKKVTLQNCVVLSNRVMWSQLRLLITLANFFPNILWEHKIENEGIRTTTTIIIIKMMLIFGQTVWLGRRISVGRECWPYDDDHITKNRIFIVSLSTAVCRWIHKSISNEIDSNMTKSRFGWQIKLNGQTRKIKHV